MFFVLFLVAVICLYSLFLCSLRVVLSMYRRYIQCWQILIFLLFLTHRVCLYHLWDIKPNAPLWVFLFSSQFVKVISSCILRIVLSTLREGQPRYLSLLWNFCYAVSSRFLVHLRWFFFFHLCLFIRSASNILKYYMFLFSLIVLIHSWLGSYCHLPFSAFHF